MVAMLKPILPIVIYYINYDYIVSELCENKDKPEMGCHGKCYLEKLTEKIEPREQDKPIATIPLLLEDYPISSLDFDSYESVIPDTFKKTLKPNFSKHFLISENSFSIFHPPKFTI